MIDDGGNARLAIGCHGSIVAVPGTPFADYLRSSLEGDPRGYHYSAPEIQWPEDYGTDKILATIESDIYGIAMVVYEASRANPSPMRQDQVSRQFPRS